MVEYRVLIIDDNPNIRTVLRQIFRGYEVLEASTGEMGLELYRTKRPFAIFLDYDLPGIKGDEVARIIREEDEDTKICMMSGGYFTKRASREAGANDFIGKPFSIRKIMGILRRYEGEMAIT